LEQLPTGGGTPLGSALMRSLELCKTAEKLGLNRVFLIILSDGRSNVPIKAGQPIETELKLLAQSLHKAKVKSLVIDTNRRFGWSGAAENLARLLEAKYTVLPYNKNLPEAASLIQREVNKLAR
jgi:magnesium chelatase subunit D